MAAGSGEAMTQELSLGNPELTFAQANHQAMGEAQFQNFLEVLDMRR